MTEYRTVVVRGAKTVAEERCEKAVLVGVDRPGLRWPVESSLAELERLADTAAFDTVRGFPQQRGTVKPPTLILGALVGGIAAACGSGRTSLMAFD